MSPLTGLAIAAGRHRFATKAAIGIVSGSTSALAGIKDDDNDEESIVEKASRLTLLGRLRGLR